MFVHGRFESCFVYIQTYEPDLAPIVANLRKQYKIQTAAQLYKFTKKHPGVLPC